VEIHWDRTEGLPEAARAAAEERLRGLAREHGDLIDLRIKASETRHHRRGGKEIRVSGRAWRNEIVASRTAAGLELALAEALDVFERELRRLRDRRQIRREDRMPSPSGLGIVDRVFPDRGYGFILTDAGDKVYFHRNAVHGGVVFERLVEGDRVALEIEAGREGLQATTVEATPPGTPSP
jgi:cold shock CspA family protein/ribosome-associated translation inhibitor RaiA